MNSELKKVIFLWLIDNPNAWQRVNAAHDYFRQYIYDESGHYIIGGEAVSDFIRNANRLIYGS